MPSLREVWYDLRWLVRARAPWRMMPNDLPPWEAVYQQTQRWLSVGVFEAIVQDFRMLLRRAQLAAALLDRRTLQSSPESSPCAGDDGGQCNRGSKVHMAVVTLGHLLALHLTPANEQDRVQGVQLAELGQDVRPPPAEVALVDPGYIRDRPRQDAADHGMQLKKASCCCHGAGWWSAVWGGPRAFAASHETMNDRREC
jgi:Putative transposase of IS4/5 family (DUF4096)/Transposase DDE domain